MIDYADLEETRKHYPIRRSIPREELIARDVADLQHLERQIAVVRDRVRTRTEAA